MIITPEFPRRVRRLVVDGREVARDCYLIDTVYVAIERFRRGESYDARPRSEKWYGQNFVTNFLRTNLLRYRTTHRRIEIEWGDGLRTVLERGACR